MLIFRKSTYDDIDTMESIIDSGKTLLRSRGIDQWQKGYPNRAQLIADVDAGIGYVAVSVADNTANAETNTATDGRVVGVCMVMSTEELSYRTIRDGEWMTAPDSGYVTVHRCAVAPDCRGQGVIGFIFRSAMDMARAIGAPSVRLDTHLENLTMQHALEKNGFTRCGIVTLVGGAEDGCLRVGYEQMV